jgi:hypothetical protein
VKRGEELECCRSALRSLDRHIQRAAKRFQSAIRSFYDDLAELPEALFDFASEAPGPGGC